MFTFISFLIISYLIGSIPTGYWFAKVLYGIDVTQHGSGNIGATNVARVLGSKRYFIIIFMIDSLKAFLCLQLLVVAAGVLQLPFAYYEMVSCGAALVLGNGISPFLSFRGGKGVSTAFGVLGFLWPFWCFLLLLTSLGLIYYFRRVDKAILTALVTTFAVHLVSLPWHDWGVIAFFTFLLIWIPWRHRGNIARIMLAKSMHDFK